MTQQEILQCLRGLSNIEGYVMKNGLMDQDIGDHFDYITSKLHNLILKNETTI